MSQEPKAPPPAASDEFISMLTQSQPQLRGYILSALAGNYANSQDVLQKTNLVLWRKAAEFKEGAPFLPWAFAVARFEVLAFLRDHQRDRHVFDPDVLEMMMGTAEEEVNDLPERQTALRKCVQELSRNHQQLLYLRYLKDRRVKEIAELTGRSVDGVKCVLLRIRRTLGDCIQRQLSTRPNP